MISIQSRIILETTVFCIDILVNLTKPKSPGRIESQLKRNAVIDQSRMWSCMQCLVSCFDVGGFSELWAAPTLGRSDQAA